MQKTVSLTVNGKPATATVEGRTLLVQLLREQLGLTGTHVGCDTSQCGACVVHINGEAVKSCTILAVQCEGADVLTIEGVANGDQLHPMQEAFRNNHALQCGFCTPGMVMSALDLVKNNANPSEREVREYLEGNLCRCTGYHNIVLAIIEGAAVMRGEAPPRQSPRSGGGVAAMPEIGQPVRRREDYRFLTGQGTYTDDIDRPGQVYAYHSAQPARQRADQLQSTRARRPPPPGSSRFSPARTWQADEIGGLPCGWLINSKDGSAMAEPPHPVLAVERVRHVGDPVAVVIAESLGQARDAAEQITVDYAVEPAVVDPVEALKPGAPQVWPEHAPGNICYDWHLGDQGAVDAAIARAARVVKLDLINNRLVPNAMEPRAAIGEFDRATNEYTLYTTSQNPHVIRLLMGAFVLHIPEARLRVVAPDVGGGFGSKIYHYAEEAIVTWAAGKVRKPVKWTAERSESFMSDAHGRDHVTHVELALDANAKFTGLKVSTVANMGAYLSTFATCIPTYLYGTLLAGTYTTPAIYVETKAVFTNTVPVDAYRGAGRPEATFLLERIVDVAADELGMDPAELRRRNFIPADAFPYQTPVALQYDSGDYQTTLRMALDAADYAGFEARRQEAANRGKYRGIGIATYIEACGIAPSAVVGSLGARAGLFEVGRGARASDRQHHGADRIALARPGARDDLRAARLRPARRAAGSNRNRARRHRQNPVRHGHLWLALAGGGRQRDHQGDGQGRRQGTQDRGASARGGRGRYRIQGRQVPRRRHRPREDPRRDRADRLCAAQFPA